jgi:hypothetical protein
MDNLRSLGIAVFFSALFLFSCATAPKLPNPLESGKVEYIPLDSGAPVYVFADIQNSRTFLENLLRPWIAGKQRDQILDWTTWAAAAVYPDEQRIQAVTWGKYPSFRAGLAFAFDKHWKKKKTAARLPYWYSAQNNLSVSLNAKQAYLSAAPRKKTGNTGDFGNVSDADNGIDPFCTEPGMELPEGFFEFSFGAILSLLLNEPSVPLNRLMNFMELPIEIPVERLFVSLFPLAVQAVGEERPGNGNQYQILLRVETPTASQARALAIMISFARQNIKGAAQSSKADFGTLAALFFAIPPVQDGKNLTFRIEPISEKEMALLLSLFSIY